MLPVTVLYVVGANVITKSISELRIPWTLIGTMILPAIIVAVAGGHMLTRFKCKGQDKVTVEYSGASRAVEI
jgi:hypothetical protein